MPKKINLPFQAVKFKLLNEEEMIVPLMDMDAIQLKDSFESLKKKYNKILQKSICDKGHYYFLLKDYVPGTFHKEEFWVGFPASKDGMSFPEFELKFEFFFNEGEQGFWALIPSLGIETFSHTIQSLESQLVEAVRLEFTRKRRLNAVHHIVATQWFDLIELEEGEMELKLLSPNELDLVAENTEKSILAEVSQEVKIEGQVMFGRNELLEQIKEALQNGFNRNVLMVGRSGVGKTVLVWELARIMNEEKSSRKIWETTASILIKELTRETGWQDNIVDLCKELTKKGDFLFVRNFFELFEVGKYEGNEVSIGDYLLPFIARGEISLISECTAEELAKIELKNPNYRSHFQILQIEEPKDNLQDIILKKINKIAKGRNLNIKKEAVEETVRLNRRFTPYAGYPGKPIRFLESILINQSALNGDSKKEESDSDEIRNETKTISKSEVIQYFCEDSGIPAFFVNDHIPMNVDQIKKDFESQIFGQKDAVSEVVNRLASIKTAMNKSGRPIASFLFVGPTGVGKTELAKVLAEFMFGNRDRMVRFDMSEYSNPWTLSRLIGDQFGRDGLLTSAVRREPFSVLLFDEIEKSHPGFYDLLLQILGEGRLTDSNGKLVNFCSSIIIMTSNIGANYFQNQQIGWNKEQKTETVKDHFISAVEKFFRPELVNRIDKIIPFAPLKIETVRKVVGREIDLFKKREGVAFRQINLNIQPAVLDHLVEMGYEEKYGARQLQRTIRDFLIIPLSKELNQHDFDDQIDVEVGIEEHQLKIEIEEDIFGGDLLLEQWDKVNFADHASELRRKIARLKEGHFYVKMLSQLDILDQQREQLKEKFWKRRKRADQYSYFLQTKAKVEEMARLIEKHEMEISLACMDLHVYSTDFEEKLKSWETEFFNLKVEIYRRLHPSSDLIHFAIYGTDLEAIVSFYHDIIRGKKFTVSGKVIWFRESFYNEEIIEVKYQPETGNQDVIKRKRQEYIKTDWNQELDFENQEPEKSGDLIYGVELEIKGLCSNIFLKKERGVQKWVYQGGNEQLYMVKTSNKEIETPTNIHRKDFYKSQNPRRTFELNGIKDNKLKINREVKRNEIVEFVIDKLEEEFAFALDNTVR